MSNIKYDAYINIIFKNIKTFNLIYNILINILIPFTVSSHEFDQINIIHICLLNTLIN